MKLICFFSEVGVPGIRINELDPRRHKMCVRKRTSLIISPWKKALKYLLVSPGGPFHHINEIKELLQSHLRTAATHSTIRYTASSSQGLSTGRNNYTTTQRHWATFNCNSRGRMLHAYCDVWGNACWPGSAEGYACTRLAQIGSMRYAVCSAVVCSFAYYVCRPLSGTATVRPRSGLHGGNTVDACFICSLLMKSLRAGITVACSVRVCTEKCTHTHIHTHSHKWRPQCVASLELPTARPDGTLQHLWVIKRIPHKSSH